MKVKNIVVCLGEMLTNPNGEHLALGKYAIVPCEEGKEYDTLLEYFRDGIWPKTDSLSIDTFLGWDDEMRALNLSEKDVLDALPEFTRQILEHPYKDAGEDAGCIDVLDDDDNVFLVGDDFPFASDFEGALSGFLEEYFKGRSP